jgi:hypothetical protein
MGRYDVLTKRSGSAASAAESGEAKAAAIARRGNPAYRQFSAYIPADLYRRLKVQLAERDLELSEGVEQALADWVQKQSGRKSDGK